MRISVQFNQTNQKLAVEFNSNEKQLGVDFKNFQFVSVGIEAEYYKGEYELTPKVDAQVIPTAQKMMMDDLTVMAIPIYSVSNTAGGATFYIATGEPDSGVAYLGKSKLGEMIL